MLQAAYPAGTSAIVAGTTIHDPFPLQTGRSLSVDRFIAALPAERRSPDVRAMIKDSGHRSLRAAPNSNRPAVLQ